VAQAGSSGRTGKIIYVVIAQELADVHNDFQSQMVEEFEALLQPFFESSSSEEVLKKLPPLLSNNSSH
jgi:hypothetical protein